MLNLAGLYEFFETIGRRGQSVPFVVGLTAGAVIGSYVCWFLCKQWMPSGWRAKHESLAELHADVVRNRDALDDDLAETTRDRDDLRAKNARLGFQVEAAETSAARASADRDALHREIALLGASLERSEAGRAEVEAAKKAAEAKFVNWLNVGVARRWEQPAGPDAPRFRPLNARRMTIISVVNLKGGVGKTTITANLAVTLAKVHKLRVLVIDLDYQGSLTNICTAPQELVDIRTSRRVVSEILRDGVPNRADAVFRCATRLEDLGVGSAYLVGTEDELEETEAGLTAHWLMGVSGDDIRFRLREALHAPAVADEYDIVLIDCPPRLSAGCVNALAASDYVLSPVLLESLSFEAVPKLLRWLKKSQAAFCPDLSVLGVVGNRVKFNRGRPISRQAGIWGRLKDICRQVWGSDVRFFDDQMIRQYPAISGRLASMIPDHAGAWTGLADAILKELPPYANHKPPTVHPIAHPPVPGIRS